MFILGFRIFVPVLLAIIKQPAKLVLPQKDIVVCVTPDSRVRIVKLVRKIQFSDFFSFTELLLIMSRRLYRSRQTINFFISKK